MATASIVALLQAALSLLALIQSTPNIPQSLQTTAIQTAEEAISLATSQLSTATAVASKTTTSSFPAQSSSNGSLQASVTSGPAPLTVTFNAPPIAVGLTQGSLETAASENEDRGLYAGDGGNTGFQLNCSNSTVSGQCIDTDVATYTYSQPGQYTAEFVEGGTVEGEVTITVTGNGTAVSQPQQPECPAGTAYQESCPTDGSESGSGSCTWGCYSNQIPVQGSSSIY